MKNVFFIIWVLVGILLFVFAAKLFMDNYRFKDRAVVLAGEVIASSKLTQPQRTGKPLVQYVTPLGEVREHAYSAPLAGNEFLPGEKISVLYDPQSGATKLDDWNELYLLSTLVGFMAFLILLPPLVGGTIFLYVRWPHGNNGLASKEKT